MKLIALCIQRPTAVLSVVLIVLLMGWLALTSIPIQLTPDVRKPLVQIITMWPGASPTEMEREIINRQEEALKGLEGLERMESQATRGRASITLEFSVATNRDRALLLINNRLTQVTGIPQEAREPRLATQDSEDNPIAWFAVKTVPGSTTPIFAYGDFVEDIVQDRLERVQGVALVNVWGGDERELRVVFDPQKLARYNLAVPDVAAALRGTNISLSAGDVEEGKRLYVVRTESQINTIERAREVVLRSTRDPATGRIARVTLADVADVSFELKRPQARIRNLGEDAIIVGVIRETGANVMEVMDEVKRVVEELRAGALAQAGLMIEQVHDDTVYIESAISLVTTNIWVGGILAVSVLLLFLRSVRATLVVSLAIPVSIIGAFVAMAALGRSINVISLAGIAFAVGMVVDAAIVVLENIYRNRERGLPRAEAALRGASQVWGAILVSAMTTVAVFAPILIMQLIVGQLFRDIAVALSVAVLLSLIVAITVVPTLANKLLGDGVGDQSRRLRIPILDDIARGFVAVVMAITRVAIRSRAVAVGIIVTVCGVAALATWLFLPKLEYLPEGNRNLVVAFMQPPPGYNLATTRQIAEDTEGAVRHHWASVTGPESAPGEPPKMSHFWFIARPTTTILAAVAVDPTRASELVPVLQEHAFQEPGTFGFISQTSLFGRGFTGSKVIDINLSGPEIEELLALARQTMNRVNAALPRRDGHFVRARPGLELGGPEVRVTPDLLRLSDVGLTAADLGTTIDAFNDGLRVAQVTVGSRRIDLTISGPPNTIANTQGIGNLPVVTRTGSILPAGSLADIRVMEGPNEIRHLERERTVQVQVRPAANMPLEQAIEIVQAEVIAPLLAGGLPPGVRVGMAGTADDLNRTWNAMKLNLLIAVLVVYLVMAILFESFVYPFIILFSVPLATAGGVAGLVILNLFTYNPLDMLTLLGFVILIGTVVNNAILIVHQSLAFIRGEGLGVTAAIEQATANRIRPIFMSTFTSVCGMMPLVIFPGAGSELYRGLGSVVVGGLCLSAFLTLLIIPSLLSLVAGIAERGTLARAAASRDAPAGAAPAPAE